MAQTDALRRYLEAGIEFTQITRSRAESIIKDLVRAGEVQKDQAQDWVEELLERRRRNADQLMKMIRDEIASQLSSLGLATKDDLAALERRVSGGAGPAPQSTPLKSPAPTKRTPSASKKVPPKKVTPKAAAKTSKPTGAKKTTTRAARPG